MRAAAKAAANAIAMAAAKKAVATALATACGGCIGFGGGSNSGGNNDVSGRRTTTAQHTSISPSPGRFPFISNQTKCTQHHPRCVKRIYLAGTRVGGA